MKCKISCCMYTTWNYILYTFLLLRRFKYHFEELPKLLPTPSQNANWYSIVHNTFANKALFLLNILNHRKFELNSKLEVLLMNWLANAVSLLPQKMYYSGKVHSSKTSFSTAYLHYHLFECSTPKLHCNISQCTCIYKCHKNSPTWSSVKKG